MSESASYYRYWGKAQPAEDGQAKFHLLPFHCLDVAAVGVAYLKQSSSLLTSCRQLLNCAEDEFLSWAAFLLALHDLGKFSEAFQSQRPDLIQTLQHREPHSGKQYKERHDSLGFWLWDNDLVSDGVLQKIGIDDSRKTQRGLKCWMLAVTGHHGMPPKSTGTVDFFFLQDDKQVASNFVQTLAELLLTEDARRIPIQAGADFESNSKMLSWWFAGVTVLADWLGSNRQFFRYREQPEDLATYWKYAKKQASIALAHSGVLPIAIEKGQTLTDFFSYIQEPSPLQHWAATVDIPPEPQIYLLEDVTGAGKTEAAIMLAYRLMAQSAAAGFFIGLPTMATANAMYKRVAQVYRKLFAGNANLTLAHGFKTLVDEFAVTILPLTRRNKTLRNWMKPHPRVVPHGWQTIANAHYLRQPASAR